MPDNIVRDANGQPMVPMGTQKPLSEVPKDTLPRPNPIPEMPANQNPEQIRETTPKAVFGTTTFDELAAKKGFKSPEDLAQAYKELESQNKKVETTLAEAIKARQESYENPNQLPPDPYAQAQGVKSNEDAVKIVDSMIARQVRATEDKFEYQMYLLQHPDDNQYAADALAIVRDNPGVKWEVAFKAAKVDNLISIEREKGRQEAYQNINNKQDAMGIHSSIRKDGGVLDMAPQDIIDGIKTGKIRLSQAKQLINSISVR